jgi:hypothetical protein
MRVLVMFFLLSLFQPAYAFTDDACMLYLCLMGASESDGGGKCVDRIKDYTDKFKNSCPDLPKCIGTSGPTTSGVLMITVSGNGGSTQSPENGKIVQVCVEEDTPYGTYCEIALTAPATSAAGGNAGTCGN